MADEPARSDPVPEQPVPEQPVPEVEETAPEQPDPEQAADAEDATMDEQAADAEDAVPPRRRFTATRALTVLLLALLGFSFTIQVRNVADDPTVAALGEEDLVRILANLDAHEQRLREQIRELEDTRERLSTAGQSRQEAVAQAQRRADELGILAGTLPAQGPGVTVQFSGPNDVITDVVLLDAVQELRSAGAEAMQVAGADGTAVRVVASTYFLDAEGGIVVDGELLTGPYTLTAIGEPQTLAPALHIPGGVVASVQQDGGTVTVQEKPGGVEVSAVRELATLQHARPVS